MKKILVSILLSVAFFSACASSPQDVLASEISRNAETNIPVEAYFPKKETTTSGTTDKGKEDEKNVVNNSSDNKINTLPQLNDSNEKNFFISISGIIFLLVVLLIKSRYGHLKEKN